MLNTPASNTRTRAVLYSRVSTQEQAVGGVSLAAQRARMEAYAVAMDIEIVAYREDAGLSAKTLARPALTAALADLAEGRADALIVFKLDRLSRSVVDFGRLIETHFGERCPYQLLSVSESIDTRSAVGRMILNVILSFAQFEREQIAERVRMAMQHLKTQGVHLGSAPLGLRVSDRTDAQGRRLLEPDAAEQDTARRIVELRAEDRTLREIAEILTSEGRETKHGHRCWKPETIRRVLARSTPAVAA